jgi:acetoin utilization deacetylase AcuC-like enzyme
MRRFFDPRQLGHAPARELHNGDWMPYAETPARAEQIVAALGGGEPARDFGMAPIAAVHDATYLDFLQSAWGEWHAAGRNGDAIGYIFPVVRRRPLDCSRIDAKLGAFSMDAATPVAQGTWDAAYWAAQTALTALDAVAGGDRHAFALCRPPGHHAGRDYMGGYCYLNNAAIAAQRAHERGLGPVAILDLDYHHGNGTQDILYDSGDIFFASIHADPRTDYPFYWGHADETGAGAGAGATLNLPLPQGTDWPAYRAAMDKALAAIAEWGAALLVVSFGADTFMGDPISHFALDTPDFTAMGRRIAEAGLPVLVVMEGGYAVGDLGANVAAFVAGFDAVGG